MTRWTFERHKIKAVFLLQSIAVEKEHGGHGIVCVSWLQWQFHSPQDAVEMIVVRSRFQGSVTGLENVVGCSGLPTHTETKVCLSLTVPFLCLFEGSKGRSSLLIVETPCLGKDSCRHAKSPIFTLGLLKHVLQAESLSTASLFT